MHAHNAKVASECESDKPPSSPMTPGVVDLKRISVSSTESEHRQRTDHAENPVGNPRSASRPSASVRSQKKKARAGQFAQAQ